MKLGRVLKRWMFYLILIIFSSIVYAALPGVDNFVNAFASFGNFLETLFQNENAVLAICVVTFAILLYNVYLVLIAKIAVFKGENGASKPGKIVALSLAIISSLSVFGLIYLNGGFGNTREIVTRFLEPYGLFVGVIISFIVFSIVYFGFKDLDPNDAWKRGVLGVAMTLVVLGTFLAIPEYFQLGWFIAAIWLLIFIFSRKGSSESKSKEVKPEEDFFKPKDGTREEPIKEEQTKEQLTNSENNLEPKIIIVKPDPNKVEEFQEGQEIEVKIQFKNFIDYQQEYIFELNSVDKKNRIIQEEDNFRLSELGLSPKIGLNWIIISAKHPIKTEKILYAICRFKVNDVITIKESNKESEASKESSEKEKDKKEAEISDSKSQKTSDSKNKKESSPQASLNTQTSSETNQKLKIIIDNSAARQIDNFRVYLLLKNKKHFELPLGRKIEYFKKWYALDLDLKNYNAKYSDLSSLVIYYDNLRKKERILESNIGNLLSFNNGVVLNLEKNIHENNNKIILKILKPSKTTLHFRVKCMPNLISYYSIYFKKPYEKINSYYTIYEKHTPIDDISFYYDSLSHYSNTGREEYLDLSDYMILRLLLGQEINKERINIQMIEINKEKLSYKIISSKSNEVVIYVAISGKIKYNDNNEILIEINEKKLDTIIKDETKKEKQFSLAISSADDLIVNKINGDYLFINYVVNKDKIAEKIKISELLNKGFKFKRDIDANSEFSIILRSNTAKIVGISYENLTVKEYTQNKIYGVFTETGNNVADLVVILSSLLLPPGYVPKLLTMHQASPFIMPKGKISDMAQKLLTPDAGICNDFSAYIVRNNVKNVRSLYKPSNPVRLSKNLQNKDSTIKGDFQFPLRIENYSPDEKKRETLMSKEHKYIIKVYMKENINEGTGKFSEIDFIMSDKNKEKWYWSILNNDYSNGSVVIPGGRYNKYNPNEFTVESMLHIIPPSNAKPGVYDVVVTVTQEDTSNMEKDFIELTILPNKEIQKDINKLKEYYKIINKNIEKFNEINNKLKEKINSDDLKHISEGRFDWSSANILNKYKNLDFLKLIKEFSKYVVETEDLLNKIRKLPNPEYDSIITESMGKLNNAKFVMIDLTKKLRGEININTIQPIAKDLVSIYSDLYYIKIDLEDLKEKILNIVTRIDK